jgi:serine/threonine protein kinase
VILSVYLLFYIIYFLDEIVNLLGNGSYGVVFEAKNVASDERYAVKYFESNSVTEKNLRQDIEAGFNPRLKSPYIMCYLFAVEDQKCNFVFMKLMKNGSLKHNLQSLKENHGLIDEGVFFFIIIIIF